MYGLPLRTGFSMKVEGVYLNRPDLHEIAEELGIQERDILIKDGILTVYNTSKVCQELIDDDDLVTFIAMTINISRENITQLKAVEEEPIKMDFDLSDLDEDEY